MSVSRAASSSGERAGAPSQAWKVMVERVGRKSVALALRASCAAVRSEATPSPHTHPHTPPTGREKRHVIHNQQQQNVLRCLGTEDQRRPWRAPEQQSAQLKRTALASNPELRRTTTHWRERLWLHVLKNVHLVVGKPCKSHAAVTEGKEANAAYIRAEIHGRGVPR